MPEIVITEVHNGNSVSARVGDTIVVQLQENPTTGFRWAPAVVNLQILELEKEEFIRAGESALGGGGVRVFRFLVKGQGTTNLQLKLTRSWESGSPSATFSLLTNVS